MGSIERSLSLINDKGLSKYAGTLTITDDLIEIGRNKQTGRKPGIYS